MNRVTQIYVTNVEGELERIDLFKDETISITDTIQDVRDIAKVFTEFSQSFSVPASKTNNKVFKHFYNADIANGFDSRTLKQARIEINNIPFKTGYITLEGVDLKGNSPNTYRITFYGNTVSLKDLIGDDKLSTLTSLDTLKEDYSYSAIKTALERSPASNDVIVPLLTHTQRLYYRSTEDIKDTGNIYYKNTGEKHGVRWDNLKYAIRVDRIVQAIESKYLTPNGFSFSNDFFTSTNESYYKLFMWLHRKKGYVESGQTTVYEKLVNGWTNEEKDTGKIINNTTFECTVDDQFIDDFDLILLRSGSVPYDIIVYKDGSPIYSANNITDGSKNVNLYNYWELGAQFTVVLKYTQAITFTSIRYNVDYTFPFDPSVDEDYTASNFSAPATFEFLISQQIPDMKILDFLTGLFKMFNLTAVAKSDGTIYVDTLDEFYVDEQSSGSPYTIDEYVDSKSTSSDSALPYREVKFKYEDTGALLAKQHEQIAATVWAEEEFNRFKYNSENPDDQIQDNISGEIYTVEAPFGHLKYERILNTSTSTQTQIQWGYCADDNFDDSTGNYDAYIGKPILFYPVYSSVSSNNVAYVQNIDSVGSFSSILALNTSINMPSNSIYFDPTSPNNSKNINFKAEINEYYGEIYDDTLFKQYYETYITQVFTKSNRIIKLKAFLPLKILLNYTLADKFIYKGRKHQINSITTNLTTGESEIELLNIVIE
jgi:hypothetical protein